MTPMIDIVFLLLVFFILTFRIAALEGDLEVQAPLATICFPDEPEPEHLALLLELHADSAGGLKRIELDGHTFGQDISQLHRFVVNHLGDDKTVRESTELEIKADYGLKYEHVVAALTAVRGERRNDGRIRDLITNIRFAPPDDRRAAEG